MNDKIIAAAIGASVAVVMMVIRDIVVRYYFETRVERRTAKAVYRSYADPLTNAALDLLWRLDEILNRPGRGVYLRADVAQTKFIGYKRLSTVYRISSLLGWIRALRRELSFLRVKDDEHLEEIKTAFATLERALADGAHIEGRRLESLLELWQPAFEPIDDDVQRARVEYCLEHQLKEFLHQSNAELATDLEKDQQELLCRRLAGVIAGELEVAAPSDDLIKETRALAIKCVSLREAWLYRDWQVGVGDLMTIQAPKGGRHYDVIGYRDFEAIYQSAEEGDKMWISRVEAIFDGLDTSVADRYDVRIEQLRNTIRAVAALFLSLSKGDKAKRILFPKTLKLAARIVGEA